jgi:hypothetical protein
VRIPNSRQTVDERERDWNLVFCIFFPLKIKREKAANTRCEGLSLSSQSSQGAHIHESGSRRSWDPYLTILLFFTRNTRIYWDQHCPGGVETASWIPAVQHGSLYHRHHQKAHSGESQPQKARHHCLAVSGLPPAPQPRRQW